MTSCYPAEAERSIGQGGTETTGGREEETGSDCDWIRNTVRRELAFCRGAPKKKEPPRQRTTSATTEEKAE